MDELADVERAGSDPLPSPDVGAPVVIVPVDGGEPVAGEVTLWSAGTLVVTARLQVGAGAASTLNGRRVWARARAPEAMVVVHAVAQALTGWRDEVELTAVVGLAVESRRSALRAHLERSVLLLRDGRPARGTSTLDLSASGCRVRLPRDQSLASGDRLQTVVADGAGEPMWLRSEVVRVDSETGEAALRFLEVSDTHRNALERDVLRWHTDRVRG